MVESQDLLAGLNEPQREAVTTTEGPVLIMAGPGSGKTRVITHRIAYLVRQQKISPWRILAVTFTNKAAREMRERLEQLVGLNESKEMHIGTFHAICARVLRAEADYLAPLGLNRSFAIFDVDDQTALIKQAIKELNLDEKQYRPATIQSLISRAKNEMLTPERMEAQATRYIEEVAARVYNQYQRLLSANNGADFDDLLMLTERLWRSESGVLKRYQQRWHYIHVDEFQDCNLPQYKLIRLLGYGTDERHEGTGNVCVVGDDDQMIYTWRGASAENVVRFERDFPDRRLVLLEQNYRSTQNILDAARNIVQRNRLRKEKHLWTALGTGAKISLHEAYDEEEEGLWTAREIQRLLARGDADKRGDIAVMYRTNVQSRALEEQFMRANIPYKVIGSRKFYERKEIKDMLAYLRLLANPYDDLSFLRIVNVPNRKIGLKTTGELQRRASEERIALLEAAQRSQHYPTLNKSAQTALGGFCALLADFQEAIKLLRLPELLDRIAERSGYGPELRETPEGEERWSNVLELRRMADDYSEIETPVALELYLENVALVGGADTTQTGENGTLIQEENKDAVTLITLHAAKGLEYPVVFIVGMDEGSLPHSRSVDKPEQLEEERRLAYVGFTRAMQRLYLVRAYRRSFFGETQATEPSRFLDDIPQELISGPGAGKAAQAGGLRSTPGRRAHHTEDYNQDPYSHRESGRVYGSGNTSRWNTRPQSTPAPAYSGEKRTALPSRTRPDTPTPAHAAQQQYRPGERVRHLTFGEGIILKSDMEEHTEFVEVQFQGKHGKKRLSMDFAHLEKLP
ncbi:MAG TPA: UvrD-helicase domain-containing protein [Ktedonobacteraceae bacterium]|jgi:DNA helicase-2/ATP-dependent DNA helicase PcrA